MNVLCRENGIDFATESTKDCRNGFFSAVFVFFVAKNPSGEGAPVRHPVHHNRFGDGGSRPGEGGPDSGGEVAGDGFNPQKQKWGDLSGSLPACFACSAVNGLMASVLPYRMSQVGYRSVTLGNGDAGSVDRHFPRAGHPHSLSRPTAENSMRLKVIKSN